MSVSIIWNAASAHSEDVIVKSFETILPGEWADCEDNAEGAVQHICEDYFRGEEYEDLEDVVVTVQEPKSIAGTYDVTLSRVVKAWASKQP